MVMTNLQRVGPSSLGAESTTWGPNGSFRGRSIFSSERYQLLDRRGSYFACTQHAHKRFDFDGRIIDTSSGRIVSAIQPLVGEKMGAYVPLSKRRPSAPYRLPRVIVSSFTNLLFGDQRFPKMLTPGDSDTQDYAEALLREQQLPRRIIQARNYGGSMGSAAMSWSFQNGKPVTEVHDPKTIWIQRWEDRDALIPAHVIKCFQYPMQVMDRNTGREETKWFWYRRDWTPVLDVIFEPCEVKQNEQPQFIPAVMNQHNDKLCHFTWIQNLPTEDVDGEPDYEGLYESFDALDIILSVIVRGATLNLDPTLVLNLDAAEMQMMGVAKGSDNAIVAGIEGDAKYLELAGTSIEAGIKLFNEKRKACLEVAQCVVPDPNEIAASGMSSVAMKVVYAPMLGKGDILREQWGAGIARHLEPQIEIARRKSRSTVIYIDVETQQEVEVNESIDLPPKVETDPESGEEKKTPRDPGHAEKLDPEWGPWFMPTPSDLSTQVTAASTAVAGKAVLSQRSANEILAGFLDRDPDEEWQRLQKEQGDAHAAQMQMMGGMPGAGGGMGSDGTPLDVTTTHQLPLPGGGTVRHVAKPKAPESSSESAPSESADDGGGIPLGPGDAASIVTVDEARDSLGLAPLGEPFGSMPLATYKALHAKPIAIAANADMGKVGVQSATPPKPAAPPGGPPGAGAPPLPGAAPGGAAPPPAAPKKPTPKPPAPKQPTPAQPPVPPNMPPRPGGGKPPR